MITVVIDIFMPLQKSGRTSMTDSLSMAVHAFASHVLISFSVDERLLPKDYILMQRRRLFD